MNYKDLAEAFDDGYQKGFMDATAKYVRDLRVCRNELCLKCGEYKNAHKGACDGCRWHET